MKAILCDHFGPYNELTITDVPRPPLTKGGVRIAVKYVTIGFGTYLLIAGKYQRKPPLPFVPGTEVSGIVIEVGEGVTQFKRGDRVVASLDWGGFAEEAVVTASMVWPVPDEVSLSVASSVALTFGTAFASLHWRAKIKEGETLLVLGAAGGVGLPAVQVGRAAGAKVIAVAGSQSRVDEAIKNGAHAGLVHGDKDLPARIMAANDGRPVDVVFDPVGEPLFSQALRCVRPEGRMLIIGFASGAVPSIPANVLLVKNINVIGFNFGYYVGWGLTDERETYRRDMQHLVSSLMTGMVEGKLKPIDNPVYEFDRFVDAFDSIIDRRSIGRVVLQVDPSADN
jgi:NADPH:quinone reductase